jgi:hypothetical protein
VIGFTSTVGANPNRFANAQMHTQTIDVCSHKPTLGGTNAGNDAESEMSERKGVGHELARNGGDWQIPENGSSGRIRTYDQSVNSRPLYH